METILDCFGDPGHHQQDPHKHTSQHPHGYLKVGSIRSVMPRLSFQVFSSIAFPAMWRQERYSAARCTAFHHSCFSHRPSFRVIDSSIFMTFYVGLDVTDLNVFQQGLPLSHEEELLTHCGMSSCPMVLAQSSVPLRAMPSRLSSI